MFRCEEIYQITIEGKKYHSIEELKDKIILKKDWIEKQLSSSSIQLDIHMLSSSYQMVYDFYDGYAVVVNKDGLYGYIDEYGNEVIPCKYEYAYPFENSHAQIKDENGYGYIDKEEKELFSNRYPTPFYFEEGLARVQGENGYGYIDKTGEEKIPCRFEYAADFHDGRARVRENGLIGYINKEGEFVIPCRYLEAFDFHEGYAVVLNQYGQYGCIDKNGKEKIPCIYRYISDFHEGLAIIEDEYGKYGYIDKAGNEVIPCKYKNAFDFHDGRARVQNEDGSYEYIDKTGKHVSDLNSSTDKLDNDLSVMHDRGHYYIIRKRSKIELKRLALKLYKLSQTLIGLDYAYDINTDRILKIENIKRGIKEVDDKGRIVTRFDKNIEDKKTKIKKRIIDSYV